jgi:hypothetical protein
MTEKPIDIIVVKSNYPTRRHLSFEKRHRPY